MCSDAGSWINAYLPQLLLDWLAVGYDVTWVHSALDLPGGDLCFYLSYGRIVDAATRAQYRYNLVVHESALPNGRGWTPMTWQILQGANRIPLTLLEAVDEVDAGPIYLQEWIQLAGTEINKEWRCMQAELTVRLCARWVNEFPNIIDKARSQQGEPSFHVRRRPENSKLDPAKTIIEQFNLLRVADNERYPAFFEHLGRRFVLRIACESGSKV